MRRAILRADFALTIGGFLGLVALDTLRATSYWWPAHILAGIALWTLAEYWMHRILHMRRFPYMRRMHMQHHQHPQDPPAGGGGSLPVIVALFALGVWQPGLASAVEGVYLGYFTFITMHWALHHYDFETSWFSTPWLRRLQTLHNLHHHTPREVWFGVTSPFWDYVFGTSEAPWITGTSECPICGIDVPHHHPDDAIARHALRQQAREWKATLEERARRGQ